jgi:pimeloyl-ACP methyl ester carboxylesterase
MLEEAVEYHRAGWSVVMADFPGHGGSDGASTTIGYLEGADVAALCRYAKAELGADKLVVYGASMGAAAALRAVGSFGASPTAMVLAAPFDRFTDTVGNRFRLMGLPAFPAAQVLVFWGSLQHGCNLLGYRLSTEAQGVICPALVLAGDKDTRAPLSDAESVENALGGAKELVVFVGAGHQSFLEQNPELWKQKVLGQLKNL